MKIIRIIFETDGVKYACDRPLDDKINDAENCDRAVSQLVHSMQEKHIVPGLQFVEDDMTKGLPVLINLGLCRVVQILNVGIFEAQQQPTEPPKEETENVVPFPAKEE